MMYQNKYVVAIKVGGKILRENGNAVSLPFGSEYSILLKNLNSLRAMASVQIDGQDVLDGTKLIVQPNSSIDLERYIRNGNFSSGNKFKFIERTEQIENHRGIKAEDGLVRVEFFPEKPQPVVIDKYHYRDHYYDHYWYPYYYPYPRRRLGDWTFNETIIGSSSLQGATGNIQSVNTVNTSAPIRCSGVNFTSNTSVSSDFDNSLNFVEEERSGITVAGSQSNQQFTSGSWFETLPSEVIVLQLKGVVGSQKVSKPITVDVKAKCQTCGRTSKANSQFCSQCGSSLRLI